MGEREDRPYAMAARRADLTGLPPAWIGVGDLDLFYEEDLAYADRLRAAGVAVEPSLFHGADALPGTEGAAGVRSLRGSMLAALSAAFDPKG